MGVSDLTASEVIKDKQPHPCD